MYRDIYRLVSARKLTLAVFGLQFPLLIKAVVPAYLKNNDEMVENPASVQVSNLCGEEAVDMNKCMDTAVIGSVFGPA